MNQRNAKLMASALLAAGLLVLPSCSDTKTPEAKDEKTQSKSYQPGVPGGIDVETRTITANVSSVYSPAREVTLDGPDGKRFTVKCGPEVINFDQIRPGDQLKLTYVEEVAVSMASETDAPESGDTSVVALAPKGARPGALMADTRRVTGTVTAIDVARHTATLQFPDGQTRTIVVRPDIDLTKRRVGEKVVIRKTDATAISVERPQPQK